MHENKLTNRVDINLGCSCNVKCRFCYYLKSVKAKDADKDLSTIEAKRIIDYIYKKGIRTLDFTGGEPTIRKDFLELVGYAKNKGFESLSLITNGLTLSNMDYALKLIHAGINDFLFSLHSSNSEIHDNITGLPGSHDLLLKGIRNIMKLQETNKITYRSNTVVCGLNYDKVGETAAFLHSLSFKTVNFILFNPIVEADSSDKDLNVEYSKAGKYLSSVIDMFSGKINKITVRYMPFCQMAGYERFITNMPQLQYDSDEWDYLVRTRIREGAIISFCAMLAGIALLPKSKRLFRESWNTIKHEGIKRFLEFKNKVKGDICKECSLEHICGGVWKEYAKWKGFGELKPQIGKKIFDPIYFKGLASPPPAAKPHGASPSQPLCGLESPRKNRGCKPGR